MIRSTLKSSKFGFTLVELLVVIGIIALLMAISMPVLRKVRIASKVTMDSAAINSMGIGLESFKNDIGYYPPSSPLPMNVSFDLIKTSGDPGADSESQPDTGAHRLFEALCGVDTLGYEKKGHYETSDGSGTYREQDIAGTPVAKDHFGNLIEAKRWGPYLELKNVNFGPVSKGYKDGSDYGVENSNNVFLSKIDKEVDRPVLYYRANKRGRTIRDIYDVDDNIRLTRISVAGASYHTDFNTRSKFTQYLWDPTTGFGTTDEDKLNSTAARPYNKDTFVLINAGPDGFYGTYDDITNFKVNK